jgi:DNA topoisomerase III
MSKTLVIAEKPSVGRDYAKALPGTFTDRKDYLESDDYVVSWAVGHLVELAEPEDYDSKYRMWSLNRLPIIPEQFKLKPIEGRGKSQLDTLSKLFKRKDVDQIINGCDAGREGELIFSYIYELAGNGKPVSRLWVSSMTRDAIREGFDHLRDGAEMAPLEAAARSRSEADWLVGMNGTRAATKVGRLDGVVSLGRVQTPTLALIVRRDLEIDAFVPETYFQVDARFELDESRTYVGRWFEGREDRTPERERAEAVAAAAGGAPATVVSVKRKERKERSPLLYDLTSLQREANRRFGMSAARTLAAAQRLYEGSSHGAVITYPRTRSQFLPSDQIPTLKPTAGKLAGIPAYRPHAEYVASLDVLPLARVVNNGKVDDHHAIIPTGELPRGELSGDDGRIYDLVARRFLAVFHPDARFEDTDVVTEAGGQSFRTKGKRLLEAGWRAPAFGDEASAPPEKRDDGEAPEQALPRIDEGESGTCAEATVLEKQTKPPGRYTESSLLGAMETAGRTIDDEELREAMKESGLGTPATRADTIERLLNVGYIDRDGKALTSTPKGRKTIELLGTHALTSAELTGSWEKRLSEIEHAQADRSAFMADIASFTDEIVEYFRTLRTESLGACPNGDGDIRENRAAFGCSSYKSKSEPGCGFTIWKNQGGFTITREAVAELLASGRGQLDGGATLVLDDEKHTLIVGEDGKPLTQSAPLGPCPNGDGEIKENRAAFGCTSYKSKKDPGCGFTVWKNQAGFTVTADEVRQLLERGEAELADGPQPGRLVLAEGNKPQIVDEAGKPLEGTLGPCPNGDGEIKENRRGFGCTSWKSKSEPGCGFTIWKSQRGFTIGTDQVRELLERGEAELTDGPQPAKLVMGEGNEPQIVGEDGKPLGRVARVQREPIATCPRCGGQIRENSRAYGCSSWKSKKNPGCGFVIWKSMKGRDITPDEAKTVIEKGKVGPLQFRDRAGEFEGYLVLTDEKAVEVQRESDGSAEAAA